MSDNQVIKQGSINIDAQNIMPIIKRWLYSDKDIFIRELVSNGVDAINKYRMMGKGADEDLRVTLTVDKDAGTLTFSDNGIGMTADEMDRYINQLAFSSAEEFLKNYTSGDQSGIIGHFGLGFYSAFMAASKVTIDTLSFHEGAQAVLWESEDGMSYTMEEGSRSTRGTTITLTISEEEKEFLDGWRTLEVLNRYCGYMSVPIYFVDIEEDKKAQEEAEKSDKKDKKDKDEPKTEPKPINDTSPIWLKAPKDVTEDEYKQTYRKMFNTFEDPLFWVHLNVDYPFNLKGILYFPHIKRDLAGQEGEIKLFNRQVFVADNIKEVIPEFLMLLKGVIDCPDLPLNVSRSFLQNDGYVRRLSAHITKKVADRLNSLFSTQRDTYESYWDDINPFIKYGCLRDNKFFDLVKDSLLLKTTAGTYLTISEYKARNDEKTQKKAFYTNDEGRQSASIALYTARDIDVVVMDSLIDINFLGFLENAQGVELSFVRVDSDTTGLIEDSEEGKELDASSIQTSYREALDDKELEVKLESFADTELAAMLTEDEQMRRFKEMSAVYGQSFPMPERYTLVLNRRNATVQRIAAMEDGDIKHLMQQQLFDLAKLSSRPLEKEELKSFLSRSSKLMEIMSEF
ncbi:MAG: molecular chaperone HtpG [Clostridiales bacterium]|nr:molecular chaperone HtpG [Clostridiales bacterium]